MADDTPPSDGIGDQGPIILGVTWPIAAIAIALLGARFYSSHFIVQRMKADFYIAAFTYAIAIIAEVTGTIAVNFAIGKHISTLSPDAIAEGLEYVWISQILFVAGMALGKCAIVAFLLQIRGPHEPRAGPIILWIIAISNIFVNGITILFILLQCQPVERLWDERISGTCNGRERNQNFAFFQGSWSSVSDMVLALYPLHILWKLQVQLHVKVGLAVLMGLGAVASVCSAVRTSELTFLAHVTDITMALTPLLIWTSVETWIILIVGSVPPCRPLFLRLFHSVAKMTTNSYGSRNQTYDQSKFSKFSRHGATTLQSGTGKDVDLQELRPKEMGALVRNQVYLGDTAGVKAYGQNNRKLGNGAGAEGGVRDSTVIKDWFEENVKDDQVVVTTKIDVDYGAASPGMPNYRHPGSPGMAMNYQPNTSTQDLLRRRDQRNDQRTNSVGGMTFFNARESV